MAAKQPPKNVKVLAILRLHFHTGGVRSKTMQDEIQSCISELWNLRKDVTRMAGDFHGSVETYRK